MVHQMEIFQSCASFSASSVLSENSVLVFFRRAFCKASASNKWSWEEVDKNPDMRP